MSQKVTSTDKDINAHDGMMNTALGLLAKGDMNCAGSTINPNADLFDTDGRTSSTMADIQTTKRRNPGDQGVVETPAEKQRREEERRRREEEERRRNTEVVQEEPEETPKSGWFSRSLNKLKEFGEKLISEENEEDNRR